MRELEKVIRVCKPDIKIFVGESITGNDCVEQAKEFDKAVGIDAIILAKADVDDKAELQYLFRIYCKGRYYILERVRHMMI